MRLTVSQARARLGQLCAQAQDPRDVIVLTRHGRDIAAIVSIAEVKRIWKAQDDSWLGRKNPLTGKRSGHAARLTAGLVAGPDGRVVSAREAAEMVREVQMTRAEERRLLAQGGLEAVEGGEIGERVAPAWVRWVLGWFG
jgi:prevent-host-death family protein